MARHAGSQQASSPAETSTVEAVTKEVGSVGTMPNSKRSHRAGRSVGARQPESETDRELDDAATHDGAQNPGRRRAERHADANLAGASRGGLRHDGVESDGRHQQRDAAEDREDDGKHAEEQHASPGPRLERAHVEERHIEINGLDDAPNRAC